VKATETDPYNNINAISINVIKGTGNKQEHRSEIIHRRSPTHFEEEKKKNQLKKRYNF